jgi:hypothetical protein
MLTRIRLALETTRRTGGSRNGARRRCNSTSNSNPASLQVTKHYVDLSSDTSVIREWFTLENISSKSRPPQLKLISSTHAYSASIAQDLQFNYRDRRRQLQRQSTPEDRAHDLLPTAARSIPTEACSPATTAVSCLLFFCSIAQDLRGPRRRLGLSRPLALRDPSSKSEPPLSHAAWNWPASQKNLELPASKSRNSQGIRGNLLRPGVDELGNQLLDWQYAYLWEFTNARILRQDSVGSRLARSVGR